MRWARLMLAVVVVLVAVPACTNSKTGVEAYKRGDYATALKKWRPLAEHGDANAQYDLGVMYRTGEGVLQDDTEAVRWYRLAAEQGDAGAQNNLALMYFNGRGVPKDYVQARMWATLATAQGNEQARKAVDLLDEMLTPAQRADAQRLAREWKPKR